MNLNDKVRVTLREPGVRPAKAFGHDNPDIGPGTVIETELWCVMQMFGPGLFNGCDLPIETDIEVIPTSATTSVPVKNLPPGYEL